MRETSLEDFLDGSETDRESAAGGVPGDTPEGTAECSGETAERSERGERTEEPPEPAVATYAWTPERADCAACEAAVQRRWRDDDRLVCADCKDW